MQSILEVLEELGIEYREHGDHHHVSQNWIGFDCPFCSPSSGKFRMGYKLSTGFVNCWSCGSHPLASALHESSGRPYQAIRDLLQGITSSSFRERVRGNLVIPAGLGPLLHPHRKYLRDRGLDPEVLEKLWGLQGYGIHGKLPWRIFIPVHLNGEVVSWTTRSIGTKEPRYLNAKPNEEKFSAKTMLFGEDFARHAVIVVEGPLDAMRVGPGAVAVMGVSYSHAQMIRISKYPIRAVCFDKDAQGRARTLVDDLKVLPGNTYRVVLDSKDPGSATDTEITRLRKEFLE